MEKLQNLFISVLRSELTETDLDEDIRQQLAPDVIAALQRVSQHHNVAHIVSNALQKLTLEGGADQLEALLQRQMRAVYHLEQMKYAYSQICQVLSREQISFIPLKGSVLRHYYPKEDMRTSCDIDILIPEERLDAAVAALVQAGYQAGKQDYHDISLFSPAKVHLELHFSVLEKSEKLDQVLKDAWKYAIPVKGAEYKFSDEFFAFQMFAHMAYHFLGGGCGVRALMDIWVMKHKMGLTFETGRELLKKAGIYHFAAEISRLSDACFSGGESTESMDQMLSYILSGGVFGNRKNRLAVIKTENTSTGKYVLKRLFLPLSDMKISYPILRKAPVFLPFCWIARWLRMLFDGKTKRALKEIKTAGALTPAEVEEIRRMRKWLDL